VKVLFCGVRGSTPAPGPEVATAYGHATVEDALRVAQETGARRFAPFHHAPNRSDAAADAIGARCATRGVDVFVAREGDTVEL
jgi:ribonuclease BN (tRNA processing enzyme)